MRAVRRARAAAVVAVLLIPALVAYPITAGAQTPRAGEDREEEREAGHARRRVEERRPSPWAPEARRPSPWAPEEQQEQKLDEEPGRWPMRRRPPAQRLPEEARPALPAPEGVPLEEPLDPDHYTCGRGDVFEVRLWGPQNLSWEMTIGLTGRAFINRVGYLDLAGRSLTEVRALVRKTLNRFYPGLKSDVSLIKPRTFLVHVVENVAWPGVYVANATERVSRVLERAGGITEAERSEGGSGSQRRITITRRDGMTVTADLLMYYLRGDKRQNPFVLDGDIIRVPFEELEASIVGPVNRPGRYELVKSKDLAELVTLAGGLKTSATGKLPVRVIRRGRLQRDEQAKIPFGGYGKPLPAVGLRDGDRVVIPSTDELQRQIFLTGAFRRGVKTDEATAMMSLPFQDGDTVRHLIERAGGLEAAADLKGAFILRGQGTDTHLIPLDLEALVLRRDFSADRPLEVGDSVVVPYRRQAVRVEGAVMRSGVFQYNPKLKLNDYIAMAGGRTKMAQAIDEVRVVTAGGKTKRYDDKPVLEPGDTIVVPESTFSPSEIAQIVVSAASLVIASVALVLSARK